VSAEKSLIAKLWAPAAAGVVIGALYLLRVDSYFYFLHGLQSQGIMLSTALAEGHGFVDLSLVGHPAHVREPPLFYFLLAVLIKIFGAKMLPMKLLTWAAYVASAALAAALFQRRTRPLFAFAAATLAMSAPELFEFFTGPLSDVPFTAIALAAILATETYVARVRDHYSENTAAEYGTARLAIFGLAAGALVLAAVMMRSLGLALLIGGATALFLSGVRRVPFGKLVLWIAVFSAPVVAGYGAWSVRGMTVDAPAGYNYVDWFMMDLAPDSPAMTAIDFHAPLATEPPRASAAGVATRSLRHGVMYLANLGGSAHDFGWLAGKANGLITPICLILAAIGAIGLWSAEKAGAARALIPIFILSYLLVVMVWPMDDPRLLIPLMPLAAFYMVSGLAAIFGKVEGAARPGREPAIGGKVIAGLCLLLIASNLVRDVRHHIHISKAPTVTMKRGFDVRFVNPATWDSYRLLIWARDNAPPGAVLMSHSTPPCWLVTGHECAMVPASLDLARARDWTVGGGADYIILDEFGRAFPGSSAWFIENVARPMVERYPADFEVAFQLGRGDARVMKVKRE